MRRSPTVRAGLHLPHHLPDDRLNDVLRQAMGAADPPAVRPELHAHWNAEFFGLDRTRLWGDLASAERQNLQAQCARDVLEEAFYIEQCGMAFAARMVLEAETVEERMLYSLFGAEEARHLHAISCWIQPQAPQSAFLKLLARTIETAQRETLFLVIQVILEGWGLRHYARLARYCQTPSLAHALEAILTDEARHHRSGVILATQKPAREEAIAILGDLCNLIRVGPVALTQAVTAQSNVQPSEVGHIWRALGGSGHAAERLSLVRSLLEKAGASHIATPLNEMGYFSPLPEDNCLECIAWPTHLTFNHQNS